MKKLIAPFTLVVALALTGCGGADSADAGAAPKASEEVAAPAPAEETPEAPDLTGEWKQSNSKSEDAYQQAIIDDAPAVFLYTPRYVYGARRSIKDLQLYPTQHIFFAGVSKG